MVGSQEILKCYVQMGEGNGWILIVARKVNKIFHLFLMDFSEINIDVC